MKTQEEILKFLDDSIMYGEKMTDFFGVMKQRIICAIKDFEKVKHFFIKEYIEKVENGEADYQEDLTLTDEDVKKEMKEYLSFAFEKAEDERGISANRSIDHFIAMAWLIDDELCKWIINEFKHNYHSYGMDILKHIEKYLEEE